MADLYKRAGRRYVLAGTEWINHAPGIWLVCDEPGRKGAHLFMRLGDATTVSTRAAFERHRDVIARVVNEQRGASAWYVAAAILDAVARAEEAGQPGDAGRGAQQP